MYLNHVIKKLTFVIVLLLIFHTPVLAEDFNFLVARNDYVFSNDNYKNDLFDFNFKKGSFVKNPTLSIKEDLRLSLYKFVNSRNDLIKNYLTMLRLKTMESKGIINSEKEIIYSKIDPEVAWYVDSKKLYLDNNTVEDVLLKSKEEDKKYEGETLPTIYYTLSQISLGDVRNIKNRHLDILESLKQQSKELVDSGKADSDLFDRWFLDITYELDKISSIEINVLLEINKLANIKDREALSIYTNINEELELIKPSLLKLNGFIKELNTVISSKK